MPKHFRDNRTSLMDKGRWLIVLPRTWVNSNFALYNFVVCICLYYIFDISILLKLKGMDMLTDRLTLHQIIINIKNLAQFSTINASKNLIYFFEISLFMITLFVENTGLHQIRQIPLNSWSAYQIEYQIMRVFKNVSLCYAMNQLFLPQRYVHIW